MRIPQSPPAAVTAPFSKGARATHTKAPLAKGGQSYTHKSPPCQRGEGHEVAGGFLEIK